MNPESQPGKDAGGSAEFKPGETVSMHDADTGHPQPAKPASPSAPSDDAPVAAPPESAAVAPGGAEEDHFFHGGDSPSPAVPAGAEMLPGTASQPADVRMQHAGQSVSWTASEFIAHEKSADWYLLFGAAALVLIFLSVILTHDVFTVVIVVAVLGLFGYVASRKPRQMQYIVDDHGVTIGRRLYTYGTFRGFSIVQEGPFKSITLMPLKRFMPPLNVYFDPADEHRIAGVLTAHLPLEEPSRDPIDNLMRHIRF